MSTDSFIIICKKLTQTNKRKRLLISLAVLGAFFFMPATSAHAANEEAQQKSTAQIKALKVTENEEAKKLLVVSADESSSIAEELRIGLLQKDQKQPLHKDTDREVVTSDEIAKPAIPSVSGALYPWAGAPFPNELVDDYGMFQRQCVSYTAWKVASSGRNMPQWGGKGHALQWDDNALSEGIAVDEVPRAGDVAVSNAGEYGHVMYVESVNEDGSINVSQYNAQNDGTYSEETREIAGLMFIHF